ncbi:MAG: hypothetical protein KDB18_14240, partial [Salinibacterium sp.]|nr:hypothetical protein [Salinibacterium sp.]
MRILSYNIRKAKGGWRARTDSHEIAVALRARRPDLVLCQEVFHARADDGDHQSRALGDILEFEATYGRNAVYSRGHHGNATLTKYTIIASKNFDLSTNPIERRGLLWAQLEIDGRPLHVFNTHLGLNVRQR